MDAFEMLKKIKDKNISSKISTDANVLEIEREDIIIKKEMLKK